MRARYVVATFLSLGVPAVLLLAATGAVGPSTASAATGSAAGEAGPPSTARPLDPANVTNISPYMQALVQGNAKYLSGDYAGAIATYRAAIQLNERSVKNPLGYYLLGEALLASGNAKEAEERWHQAESFSTIGDPTMHGRVLFVIADLKEREKKWEEARAAWTAYAEWASRFGDGGAPEGGMSFFPETAAGRIKAMDEVIRLDKQTDGVRRRIKEAAETDGGLFTNLDATPG